MLPQLALPRQINRAVAFALGARWSSGATLHWLEVTVEVFAQQVRHGVRACVHEAQDDRRELGVEPYVRRLFTARQDR